MQRIAYWARKWEKLGDGVLKTFLSLKFPGELFHLFLDSWCQTNQLAQLWQWDFCYCDTCQGPASQWTLGSSFPARDVLLSTPLHSVGCPWLEVGFRPPEDFEVLVQNVASKSRTPHSSGYRGFFLISCPLRIWIHNLPLESWDYPFIFYVYSIPKILLLQCMALLLWTLHQPGFTLSCLSHHGQCFSLLLT